MQRHTPIILSLLVAACGSAPTNPDADANRGTANKSSTSDIGNESIGSRLSANEMNTILKEHNRVRANVGVDPLQWSAPVAKTAQNWADHLAGTSCDLVHSKGSGYGENLFMGTSGYYGAYNAVSSWESEKKDYHGGVLTPSNWYPSGHYTQVVWQNTQRVGCAQSSCNGSTIVVCNYDPPGNHMGQAAY